MAVVRVIVAKPRPDVRVIALEPEGGGGDSIDFALTLQNFGSQPIRASITAKVGESSVACEPSSVDLLYNRLPVRVRIVVPRPSLGDLVPELEHQTTLYGRPLEVEVAAGSKRRWTVWTERIYSAEEDEERHAVQRRTWRLARGEETAPARGPDDEELDPRD